MIRRLFALTLKEWRCVVRREVVFLVVIQPVIFCLVWGFCATLELRNASLVVLDQANTHMSRDVVRGMEASGRFDIALRASSIEEVERAMVSGKASTALVIPHSFPTDLRRGRSGALAMFFDGTDPVVATTGESYALSTVQSTIGPAGPESSVHAWYNRSLRSVDLLLLGAICYQMMFFAGYPAQSLLEERASGTLIPLSVSPVTTFELWFATVSANAVVALWGTLVQVALMIFVADVPFRGNGSLLLGVFALFTFIHMNIGCVMAWISGTVIRLTIIGLVVNLLFMAVSGFLIPSSYLPDWTQKIGEYVPLTHGLRLVRAVYEKGVGLETVGDELRILGIFAIVTTGMALLAVRALLHADRN